MRNLYVITKGEFKGRIGRGGCSCENCSKLRGKGLEKLTLVEGAAVIMDDGDFELYGSENDGSDGLNEFMSGKKLSELKFGSEDLIRSHLIQMVAQSQLSEMLGGAISMNASELKEFIAAMQEEKPWETSVKQEDMN